MDGRRGRNEEGKGKVRGGSVGALKDVVALAGKKESYAFQSGVLNFHVLFSGAGLRLDRGSRAPRYARRVRGG